MNLISIHEASKEVGDKSLYKNISFGLDESEKVAIVGVNGCGKSTLLKILAGQDQFDQGKFASNKLLSVGYLEQTQHFKEGHTIEDFIFASDNPRVKVLRDYLDAHNESDHNDHLDEKFILKLEKLEDQMSVLDVWTLESDAREILSHLNIHDMHLPMSELSGGMLRKVGLARLLIEDSNLLLLDEPTNHLDIASIAWLESYLIKIKKALIIITHDRYFLDNITNHILEVDNQKINKFKGNYSTYLEKKAEIEEIENRTLARSMNILTRELKWLRKMPKARGTKQKARIQQVEERVIDVDSKKPKQKMGNFYSIEERLGKKILEIVNISKSFSVLSKAINGKTNRSIKTTTPVEKKAPKVSDLIFPSFSYEFRKKERIAIVGDNGAGKTTFLKVLMKTLEPDSGKVTHGVNTRVGYLSQMNEDIDEGLSVIHSVRDVANYIEFEDGKKITASQLLDRFLFTGSKHGQKVNKLSGGERRRLDIIRLLMSNPNFLILDEPTNDLDLQTLNIFEEYLLEFPGCLLVVSHDRYFLDKLADTLFVFEKGQPIQRLNGLCSDYVYQKLEKEKQGKKKPSSTDNISTTAKSESTDNESSDEPSQEVDYSANAEKPDVGAKKLSYKHKLRKEEIEKEIPGLEIKIEELHKQLSSGESDAKLLHEWFEEQSSKENHLMSLLAELESIDQTLQ